MLTALLTLLAGCTPGGILYTEDTGDTGEAQETGPPEERWEATFWELDHGQWVSTCATLGQRVRGLDLDGYSGALTTAGGERLFQWSGTAWEDLDYSDAPGPIDAYDVATSDRWIAVGERIYSWTPSPGVWARVGEKAPGPITGLVATYGAQGTRIAVGDQVYTWTAQETWEPLPQAAPGPIQCLSGTYQRTLAGVDGALYELLPELGWVATDLPAVPEPTLSACTLATTLEEGEPVDHYRVAAIRQTR